MVFRVAAWIVLAGVAATAQPRIERGETAGLPGGRIEQVPADANARGTVIPVNGRRTTVIRVDNQVDAEARGFTASQLAALGIFGASGTLANAIVGFARDSAASVLPGAAVRLRDLRLGSVVAAARTNGGGQFAFPGLPPGTYLVELVAPDGIVLAVSDAVSVESGDIVQTVVQMSAPRRSFAAWMGLATTTAVNLASQSGILARQPAPSASPES